MVSVTQKCGLIDWGGLCPPSLSHQQWLRQRYFLLMEFSVELEAHLLLYSLTWCYPHALWFCVFFLVRPKPRASWKNFYEIEMHCFVVFLWLSNLFSRSLIKWHVRNSQHKYHLLSEAAKVTICWNNVFPGAQPASLCRSGKEGAGS